LNGSPLAFAKTGALASDPAIPSDQSTGPLCGGQRLGNEGSYALAAG
jgi:hypothetical protein